MVSLVRYLYAFRPIERSRTEFRSIDPLRPGVPKKSPKRELSIRWIGFVFVIFVRPSPTRRGHPRLHLCSFATCHSLQTTTQPQRKASTSFSSRHRRRHHRRPLPTNTYTHTHHTHTHTHTHTNTTCERRTPLLRVVTG